MDALQGQAMSQELGRRRRLELQKIASALARIDSGDFGWCLRCGEAEPEVQFVAFDLNEGGVLCRTCRSGQSISPGALAILREILGGQLVQALAREESPATHEVSALATRALEFHIERHLRAVAMFESH